jgi:hypothetical protein
LNRSELVFLFEKSFEKIFWKGASKAGTNMKKTLLGVFCGKLERFHLEIIYSLV